MPTINCGTARGAFILMMIATMLGCTADSRQNIGADGEKEDSSATIADHSLPMDTVPNAEMLVDTTNHIADSLACVTLRDWPVTHTIPIEHAQRIVRGDDSCVMRLIDSIVSLSSSDGKELSYLEAIAESSDGDVSEYVQEVSGTLFHKAPANVIELMSHSAGRNMLRWFLVLELRDELESAPNRQQAESVLRTQVADAKAGLSSKARSFAEVLLRDVFAAEQIEQPR